MATCSSFGDEKAITKCGLVSTMSAACQLNGCRIATVDRLQLMPPPHSDITRRKAMNRVNGNRKLISCRQGESYSTSHPRRCAHQSRPHGHGVPCWQ
jgi:hypothetical protein